MRIIEDGLLTLFHISPKLKWQFFGMTEDGRKEIKLLFVSDTNDNHNIICQQNSKVNEKKTSSVLNILQKKDGIELCSRPSLVFG